MTASVMQPHALPSLFLYLDCEVVNRLTDAGHKSLLANSHADNGEL